MTRRDLIEAISAYVLADGYHGKDSMAMAIAEVLKDIKAVAYFKRARPHTYWKDGTDEEVLCNSETNEPLEPLEYVRHYHGELWMHYGPEHGIQWVNEDWVEAQTTKED